MTWEEHYKLPLKLDIDEEGVLFGNYAWAKDKQEDYCIMALTFDYDIPSTSIKKIVAIINGEEESKFDILKWKIKDSVDFYFNKKYHFCVRGWGGLTGTGGLNLSVEEAEKIQDGFVNYIFSRLNKV